MERVLVDGGRRHSESRGVATEDGGRRTSQRVWRINGRHGRRGDPSRDRVSEGQGSRLSEDRERIREESDRRCRVPTGKGSEDVGFSRDNSRRVSEDLDHGRSVSEERVRGDGGHRPGNSWERLRGGLSSDASFSEVGSHPTSDSSGSVRDDRGLRLGGTWEEVREVRGPRASDSGGRGSDDRRSRLSGSWEGASVDGGRSLSSSWEGVSEDRGYLASDSSAVSVSEDASRRRFWERESEDEGSRCRASWGRTTEDGGPGPSDDEGDSRCCSGSWVTASEDRRSSGGLDSTPPRSPSRRTMPGVSDSGPSTSSTETATPCESDRFAGPCLCHTPLFSLEPLLGISLSHLSLISFPLIDLFTVGPKAHLVIWPPSFLVSAFLTFFFFWRPFAPIPETSFLGDSNSC